MGGNGAEARAARLVWWLTLGPAAGLLLVVTATVMADHYDVPVLVAFAAATAGCAALPLALVRSRSATVLQLAAVATFAWTQEPGPQAWPLAVPVMVLLNLHLALIGLRRGWREAVTSWWVSVLFGLVLAMFDPLGRDLDDGDTVLVIFATNSLMVVFGAILWRQRKLIQQQLATARRDVAVEQAQRAVAEERTRIARELHDVVAHSMSVIHMQATSAAYRIKDVDAESRAEFARIAAGTRATLQEMRQLLAVLRDEQDRGPLQPMPDLQHLNDLAENARRGGIKVDISIKSTAPLPETTGLTAYRIVQESLSNVVRHAPGAEARVTVATAEGELTVEVVNDAPRGRPQPIEDPHRTGHGLIGMRERARLAGGTVRTDPTPGGGFRVLARLPLPSGEK